jgi:hypothetical protein
MTPEGRAYLATWLASVTDMPVSAVEEPTCDGIHDEQAPAQYLCSRCFPSGDKDLPSEEDDGYEDARRDQETER